ncbi:MAG: hypothetical protein IJ180_04160 [Bacteroidales bacterium]|nr:hypothetical protein [Bacteroidales bacterium]
MKKYLFLLICVCLSTFAFAQYDVEEDFYEENSTQIINSSITSYREPGLAWAMSFFVPGMGQLYNGENFKGVSIFVGTSALAFTSFISFMVAIAEDVDDEMEDECRTGLNNSTDLTALTVSGITFIGALALWIYSQYDAYHSAEKINQKLGFVNIDLGKNSTLSFSPNVFPSFSSSNNYNLNLGAKLCLSF